MARYSVTRPPRILKANAPSRDHPKEYAAWKNMKDRCYNPRNASYPRYGGRGITVCDSWLESFDNFYADMGDCPIGDGWSFGRKGHNQPVYCKEACEWQQPPEQHRDRSVSFIVDWPDGRKLTLGEIASMRGETDVQAFVSYIWNRMHLSSYTLDEALNDFTDGRKGDRRRRHSMLLSIRGGEPITWKEAAEQQGMTYGASHQRHLRGATIAQALNLADHELVIVQQGVWFDRKRK